MPAAEPMPAAPHAASGAASGTGAAVTADGLGLRGPRGWVYRDVSFHAPPGALVAVEGDAGTGRTSLLLTLAGRMRPTGGRAEVGGLPLPGKAARVRRIAALGPVPGVNDLEEALTVAEHLRERRLLHAFPGIGARSRCAVADALALAGLEPEQLPAGARTPVRELDSLQRLRLATALALTGRPRLVCVDDVDDRLHSTDRAAAWRMLHDLAASGVTVLAATTDTGAAAEPPTLTVRLTRPEDGSGPALPGSGGGRRPLSRRQSSRRGAGTPPEEDPRPGTPPEEEPPPDGTGPTGPAAGPPAEVLPSPAAHSATAHSPAGPPAGAEPPVHQVADRPGRADDARP